MILMRVVGALVVDGREASMRRSAAPAPCKNGGQHSAKRPWGRINRRCAWKKSSDVRGAEVRRSVDAKICIPCLRMRARPRKNYGASQFKGRSMKTSAVGNSPRFWRGSRRCGLGAPKDGECLGWTAELSFRTPIGPRSASQRFSQSYARTKAGAARQAKLCLPPL